MGIGKNQQIVTFLVFIILVTAVCFPINAAHAAVQNIAVTKLSDEACYKKTLFEITIDQTTYHIMVEANITTVGNETLVQLKATLYNPENETLMLSAAIPDNITHPYIGTVYAVHILVPEWAVQELINVYLPIAMIVAIVGEVFYILNEIINSAVGTVLGWLINGAPLVWVSIPFVFRQLLIADSNNDGSFDLYIPISAWDAAQALNGDYYVATSKNWWIIEQREYYIQVLWWSVPLFTYYVAQWVSSRLTSPPPLTILPNAEFVSYPSQPIVNETVNFTSISFAQNGTITSCQWWMGDGNYETGENFTYVYRNVGSYNVTLMVTDNNGLTGNVTHTISVQLQGLPGTAALRVAPDQLQVSLQAGHRTTVEFLVGETLDQSDLLNVTFTAFDLSEIFTNQTISSGNVTFDRNDITVAKGTYTNVTVTFNAPSNSPSGWYCGNITVASANGGNSTVYATLQVVRPQGPEAEFTVPEIAIVGQIVEFNASASQLGWNGMAQTPITEYRWDFGDGDKTATAQPIMYHSFNSSGIYSSTLTVYARGATPEIATITHTLYIQPVNTSTVIVPDNYPTIQTAINNANDGDTVFVRRGIYYEHVVVNKTVSLIGEDESNTIVDGNGTGTIFHMLNNDSNITGFTIQNSGSYQVENGTGVYIDNDVVNCHIIGNNIIDNKIGVLIICAWDNYILENNIRNNSEDGFYLWTASHNNITDNNITNNYYGVTLDESSGNLFFHNNFVNNTYQAADITPAWPYGASICVWDDGYPSGGNYWSDYVGGDLNYGPYQNVTGSDGIGDIPYTISFCVNSRDNYPFMKLYSRVLTRDVAVTDVEPLKTVVGQGYTLPLDATATNMGDFLEGFNVTLYANATAIVTQTVTVASGKATIIALLWNTAGFAYGNYTITAYAWPVSGETNTANNNGTRGSVIVTISGDVDGNLRVDMTDVMLILSAFGSSVGQPRYIANADIDGSLQIDMTDIMIALSNFGQHYP
jgi:parallel beta-helix repeat protein